MDFLTTIPFIIDYLVSLFVLPVLAGIAIYIIINWLFLSKKNISYEHKIIPITTKIEGAADIKILYKSEEIKNISYFEIKIINTGQESIRPDDYEIPIKLIFNTDAKILNTNILLKEPENLNIKLESTGSTITFNSFLINGEECFVITSLISNLNNFKIDGRILGVKNIKPLSDNLLTKFSLILSLLIMLTGLLYSVYIEHLKIIRPSDNFGADASISLIISVIGCLVLIFTIPKTNKIKIYLFYLVKEFLFGKNYPRNK